MSKIPFSKVPLTYSDQIKQLEQRGLLIENKPKAAHLLANVSYYRLSGYWYPLLEDKKAHIFKKNATFETAFKIYAFDRELRKLVLAEIEKIEVAIRAKMVYVLSHSYGPYWFTDATIFKNNVRHADCLSELNKEFLRSDEQFIKAFKKKYSDPLPPSWIMMEVASFGKISMLFENLKSPKEKREIAHYFGLADSVFSTWIHSIVYLRNVCAHHTRLWNREMSIRPEIPRNPHNKWILSKDVLNNRTFYILSMIVYLLNTVNPKHRFKNKLNDLLKKYPQIDLRAMGFPNDWNKDPFWS